MSLGLLFAFCSTQIHPAAAGGSGGGGVGGAGGSPPLVPAYPTDAIEPAVAPVRLPGGGGVNDAGAATYSIPLQVPDGPGGLKPNLSLSYAGGSSNGALGVGFEVSGLSVITPCAKTFATEGEADGVDFDESDAFCLDGQKLVRRNDLNAFQAAFQDIVYSTEIDNFTRVVAHRTNATDRQPYAFTVWSPDGTRSTYEPVNGIRRRGVSAYDAATLVNAAEPAKDTKNREQAVVAVAYPVRRVEDRLGNVMKLFYEIGNDTTGDEEMSYRIGSIEYSYASAAAPARRKVVFGYAARTDHIVSYLSGVKIVTRSRIDTISMYAPNPTAVDRVWTYALRYEYAADSKRSRLIAVKLTPKTGVDSWSRQFEWTNVSAGVTDHVAAGPAEFDAYSFSRDTQAAWRIIEQWEDEDGGFHWKHPEPWYKPTDVRILAFDADGDGIDDILYRTHESTPDWYQNIYLGSDGWVFERWEEENFGRIRLRRTTNGAPLADMIDVTASLEGQLSPQTMGLQGGPSEYMTSPPNQWLVHLGKSRVTDFDADGRNDLLLMRTFIQHTGAWLNNDLLYLDKFTYGHKNMGSFDGTGWGQTATTGIEAWMGFHHPPLEGPMWEATYEEGYSWAPRFVTPPFQMVLADVDGDGAVERVDAFAHDEMVEMLDFPDINWGAPEEQLGLFPYLTELSTNQGPRVGFSSDTVNDSLRWMCGNGNAAVIDYEGDGRDDVLFANEGVQDQIAPAAGIYDRARTKDAVLIPGPPERATVMSGSSELWGGNCGDNVPDLVFGDFNGDGLADALYPPGSFFVDMDPVPGSADIQPTTQAMVRWNLGNGFGPAQVLPVNDPGLEKMMEGSVRYDRDGVRVAWDRGTRVVDLNRDGRADVLAMRYLDEENSSETAVIAYLSTGNELVATQLGTWNSQSTRNEGFTTFAVGELTGDGAPDFVRIEDGRIVTTEMPWRNQPDLLAKVTDSGVVHMLEQFTYSSAWWGNGPRPAAADCGEHVECVRSAFPVVRQHAVYAGSKPDGSARYRETIHSYADPRRHRRGRGFLGFGEHRIWDRKTGGEEARALGNTTYWDANPAIDGGELFPLAGVPVKIRVTTPDEAAPTDLELETANPNFPGHSGNDFSVDARTVVTESEFAYRGDATGKSLVRLPVHTVTTELDLTATVTDVNQPVPRYSGFLTGSAWDERVTDTVVQYDAIGRPSKVTTEIAGGTVTIVEKA